MEKNGNEGLGYCIRETRLGLLLLAASQRGVCFVCFGSSERLLEEKLAKEFPYAQLMRSDEKIAVWSDAIVAYVDGRSEQIDLPLDVRGSLFQRRVWKELAAIPRGETRSYSDIARAVGAPRGARAVARACASNPTPIVIPCHRVIEKGGSLGGYALGTRRKRRLLRSEGALIE